MNTCSIVGRREIEMGGMLWEPRELLCDSGGKVGDRCSRLIIALALLLGVPERKRERTFVSPFSYKGTSPIMWVPLS